MTWKTGLPSIISPVDSFTQVRAVIGDVSCPLKYARMHPRHPDDLIGHAWLMVAGIKAAQVVGSVLVLGATLETLPEIDGQNGAVCKALMRMLAVA